MPDDFHGLFIYRSSNHKVRDSFQNFFWILYNKHLINLNTQKSQAIRLSFRIYQMPDDFHGLFIYRSSNHKVRDSFQNFFWILYNKHLINLNTQKSQAIRLSFRIYQMPDVIFMACYQYPTIIISQSTWQFSKFLLDSLQQTLDKFKYPKKSSDPTVLQDLPKAWWFFMACLYIDHQYHKVRDSFQNFFWILYNKHLINLNTQKSQAIRLSFRIYTKCDQNFFWMILQQALDKFLVYRSSNHKVRDSFQNFFWILYNKHLINLNTQKSQAIRLSFKIYQKPDDFHGLFIYRSSNHKVRDSFQNFFWILYNKHLINLNTQKKVKRSDCPSRFTKISFGFFDLINLNSSRSDCPCLYIDHQITKYVTVFKISFGFFTTSTW